MAAHINFIKRKDIKWFLTRFISIQRCNVLFQYRICSTEASEGTETEVVNEEEEFRTLELFPQFKKYETKKKRTQSQRHMIHMRPPREKIMPIDQDWSSVWPSAKTFRPSAVPLPLFQGYVKKGSPPGKYSNLELMKIPNFLHLTPPAIQKQCAAIKKFCTPWPKGLETDEKCDKHFPVEIVTSDYCHSSPSIRDERARIVTLKIKLSVLDLDYHARDKLLRLVGDRYNPKTDMLSLVADRCPLKKQNYDYLMYLLTVLYHESWILRTYRDDMDTGRVKTKIEPWEAEKTEADMEKFFWEGSRAEKAVVDLVSCVNKSATSQKECSEEEIKKLKEVEDYGSALSQLLNEGENEYTLGHYKEAVCKLLGLNIPANDTYEKVALSN